MEIILVNRIDQEKTSKTKAFTLIELLVVIVIISILAAILFPVFASAREKSRQATCQTNMKEIGTSLEMYITDNDECLPFGLRPANATEISNGASNGGLPTIYGAGGIWWPQLLAPYVDTFVTYNGGRNFVRSGVFLCPDTPSSYSNGGSTYSIMSSYAINDGTLGNGISINILPVRPFLFPAYGNSGSFFGASATSVQLSMPKITSPSTVLAFCEENFPTGAAISVPILPNLVDQCQAHYHNTNSSGGDTCTNFELTYGRHSNGSNIVYLDGHVKWIPAVNMHYDVGDMWGQFAF